jgi:hypothetical protein
MKVPLRRCSFEAPCPVDYRGMFFFTAAGIFTGGYVGTLKGEAYLLPLSWHMLDDEFLTALMGATNTEFIVDTPNTPDSVGTITDELIPLERA